jgi:hypothetical protein
MASSSVAASATPEAEQLGYDPSPWGDFFIAYEREPPQVYGNFYSLCPKLELNVTDLSRFAYIYIFPSTINTCLCIDVSRHILVSIYILC